MLRAKLILCISFYRYSNMVCSWKCALTLHRPIFTPDSPTLGPSKNKLSDIWTHNNDGQTNNPVHPRNR